MIRFNDPLLMPITLETPHERLARGLPLIGTPGQNYVENRGIPVSIAHDAGVRFDPDWDGRPAVIAPMCGPHDTLCSVHGRYLQHFGKQNKMFTIGPGSGILSVLEGFNVNPIIIVEGLFDALSLAVCGYGSLATVGRWAPWLPEFCKGRLVILAFDANRPGESQVSFYKQQLVNSHICRLTPPGHCKDWNTALTKRGPANVGLWLRNYLNHLTTKDTLYHE